MCPHLSYIMPKCCLISLHGHIGIGNKKFFTVAKLQMFYILHAAVHLCTGIWCKNTVQKFISALNGSFQYRPACLAHDTGHIIGSHLDRACTGSTKSHTKTAWQIQEHLWYQGADTADCDVALRFCFLYHVIARFLQHLFKVKYMF